jgi:large repetitive protein
MKFIPTRRSLLYTPPVAAGGALGLQTSLTAFWSLENTSWTDDTGNGSTLTATGSPTSDSTAPAVVGNYAAFPGSAYLSRSDNTNINAGGGSFSIQAWVYTPAALGEAAYVNKGLNGFANQEWGLGTRFTSANVWSFAVYDSTSTATRAEDTVGISTNTWTHLVGTYTSGTKGLVLYKNGSSVGTATASNALQTTAQNFNVGNGGFGGGGVTSGNRIDQVGFWKNRVLSAGDVTALYNSGAGLSYAAMA